MWYYSGMQGVYIQAMRPTNGYEPLWVSSTGAVSIPILDSCYTPSLPTGKHLTFITIFSSNYIIISEEHLGQVLTTAMKVVEKARSDCIPAYKGSTLIAPYS